VEQLQADIKGMKDKLENAEAEAKLQKRLIERSN